MSFDLAKGTYVVVGLGLTGTATIDFLLGRGMKVAAFEEISEAAFKAAQEKYRGRDVLFFLKDFPLEVLGDCQGLFVSPGVPLTRSWVHEAKRRSVPVLGEMELASRYLKGSILAVTGTNGKSTTVSLLHRILSEGGKASSLKGNIGSPLITAVTEPPKDFYVVEASSYQLETIETFHPRVAVLMNVTADHLDRYEGMDDYAAAKGRIAMNQTPEDFFITNADDPTCVRLAARVKSRRVPFSLVNPQSYGGYATRDELVIKLEREDRYPLVMGELKGLHNQENTLAAILAATLMGAAPAVIRRACETYKPLAHRTEYIGTFKGMKFYDDSKGTNVGSVVMSLASFDQNVILILGGRDKGGDYGPLKALIRGKVKTLIVMGEARQKIGEALGREAPRFVSVENMREALEAVFAHGVVGDTVLLSPACSSFDQYKNYAERGDDFKKWARHFGEKT